MRFNRPLPFSRSPENDQQMRKSLAAIDRVIVSFGNRWQAYLAAIGAVVALGTGAGLMLNFARPFFPPEWGLAEAIILGVGAIALLALIVSLGLNAWAALRLAKSGSGASRPPAATTQQAESQSPDTESVKRNLDNLTKSVADIETRYTLMLDRTASFRNETESAFKGISEQLKDLKTASIRTTKRFYALRHRELLERHRKELVEWADALDGYPESCSSVWSVWQEKFNYFKSHLMSWQALAQIYDSKSANSLFEIDQEMYKSTNWTNTFSEFPNSDAVHDYKTFRLLKRNLEMVGQEVDRAIDKVAFSDET